MKNLRKSLGTHLSFLKITSTSLLVVKEWILSIWRYRWLVKSQWTKIAWKRKFYSNLNLQNITDEDYIHAKRLCRDFDT